MINFCPKCFSGANNVQPLLIVLTIVHIQGILVSTYKLSDISKSYERPQIRNVAAFNQHNQQDALDLDFDLSSGPQQQQQQAFNYHSEFQEEEDLSNNEENYLTTNENLPADNSSSTRQAFDVMPAMAAPPNKWRSLQRYRGFAMLRTQPQTKQQVEQLRKFLDDPVPGIDFWREPTRVNQSVDIMLSPEARDAFRYTLNMMNLSGRILIPDIGKAMINGRSSQAEHSMRADSEPHSFFKTYRTYLEIEKHLSYLRLEYSDLIQVVTVGRSYENRQLYLVKLSSSKVGGAKEEGVDVTNNTIDGKVPQPSGGGGVDQNKAIIWIDAGHHAREWISHASALFIMETLLRDYKAGDEQILQIFEKYDFYFMPVVNPDGYQYSHDYDRLWRKTRSRHGNGGWLACAGVDPNRNYPTQWMKAGASSNPCSEIYAGPKPLSEPETVALSQTLLKYKSRVKAYISLHSYSQLMLSPWGHSRQYPPNYDKLESLAKITLKAIESIHGTKYQFGTSSIVLYPAAGGSDDFAMADAGIKYAYTLELRDQGQYGFDLPDKLIKPTTEETYFGLIALIRELINRKEY